MKSSLRGASALLLALSALSCDGPPPAEQERPPPPPLEGRWQGTLKLQRRDYWMVADFFPSQEGTRGKLDFALLRVLDHRPIVRYEAPRLELVSNLRDRTIRFYGTREKDDIRGTLTIDALQLVETPFTLHRLGEITPPPYAEREVRVESGGVTLGGVLLVPPGEGPHPAVVLIPILEGGKGEMSRENLRFYADLFARGGIAALLYDQRRSAPSAVTLDVRASDALAAVGLLKSRPEIDAGRIGLLGFELGGIVAPMAAASSPDVAFVISVSGPGVSRFERMVHSVGDRMRRLGFSYGDINDAMATFRRAQEYDRNGGDPAALQAFLDRVAKERWAPLAEVPMRVWRRRTRPEEWRDRDRDPAQFWERVRGPVLLVYGMQTEQFAARESAERIEAALARGNNQDVTVKLYGGDHRLQQARWFPHEMADWLAKKIRGGR